MDLHTHSPTYTLTHSLTDLLQEVHLGDHVALISDHLLRQVGHGTYDRAHSLERWALEAEEGRRTAQRPHVYVLQHFFLESVRQAV